MFRLLALLLAMTVAFAPAVSIAASQKMFAQVTRVTGTAHHSYAALPGAREKTTVGARLFDGDTIVTGAGGSVELLLQSGGSLLVDQNTTLKLTSLRKSSKGLLEYTFDLAFGRIKSYLSRQLRGDKIEYVTKAAIAGIAGTPPHVIEVTEDKKKRKLVTGVYLLKGKSGLLSVRGLGPKGGSVMIKPGMGTTVLEGLAPLAPFALSPAMLQGLEALKPNFTPSAPSSPSAPSAPSGASGGSGASISSASGGTGMGIGTMAGIGAGVVGGAVLLGGGIGGSSGGGSSDGGDSGGTDYSWLTGNWTMNVVNISNNCPGSGTAHFGSGGDITGSLTSTASRCNDYGKVYDVTGSWTGTSSGADVTVWSMTGHAATGTGSFDVSSSTHRATLTR